MSGPGWLEGGLAVLMIAIAVYCACRLAVSRLRGRETERDADGLHVVMGVAMAGMLEPRLTAVPGAACGVVFAAGAAWFAWQAIRARGRGAVGTRCAHPAPHAIESAAMVYMLVPIGSWRSGHGPGMAMPSMAMPGMSPGATTGNPAITLILALFMLGYVLWALDRLAGLSRAMTAATARGTGAAWSSLSAVTAPAAASASGPPAPASLASGHRPGHPALAPRAAACYKIAMAMTMGYMLVMML
ncbi:MAG TPA: DUF5134 domain-containing protein [Streptosporangiaceae bacterium]|nr:DUF5134 domain-containing protein [Streptosporangiaceae bacterium]